MFSSRTRFIKVGSCVCIGNGLGITLFPVNIKESDKLNVSIVAVNSGPVPTVPGRGGLGSLHVISFTSMT